MNLVCHRRIKILMMDTWKMCIFLSLTYVGGEMLLNRPKYRESVWTGTLVPIFLKAVFDVLPGIREGLLDLRLLHNVPGKGNPLLPAAQEQRHRLFHGKDEFLQAIQVLAPRFRLYVTFMPNNASVRTSCLMKQW